MAVGRKLPSILFSFTFYLLPFTLYLFPPQLFMFSCSSFFGWGSSIVVYLYLSFVRLFP